MNREKTKKILEGYGSPKAQIGDKIISFARQSEANLAEIEAMTDETLVEEWKRLVYLNEIIGEVSLNDLQRVELIQLEMEDRRNINIKDLTTWFHNQCNKFNRSNYRN